MQRYYYSREGTDVNGPISDVDLWKMVQADILPSSVQVCREGSEEWTAIVLSTVPAPESVMPAAVSALVVLQEEPGLTDSQKNDRVIEIIGNYGWGAMGAMVAIPLPGADIAATFAVWGVMIVEIAGVYGYAIDLEDAKRLGSDLFKTVILTTAAWFASAKTASFVCKFIPFAGTATAFVIDSVVAGIGAKSITARLGTAAALYYQSDKTMAPETMAAHVKNVVADPKTIRSALGLFTVGVSMEGLNDLPDLGDHHHDHTA